MKFWFLWYFSLRKKYKVCINKILYFSKIDRLKWLQTNFVLYLMHIKQNSMHGETASTVKQSKGNKSYNSFPHTNVITSLDHKSNYICITSLERKTDKSPTDKTPYTVYTVWTKPLTWIYQWTKSPTLFLMKCYCRTNG